MGLKVVMPPSRGMVAEVAAALAKEGCSVVHLPPTEPGAEWTEELLSEYFSDADAFTGVFRPLTVTRACLEAGRNLRVGVSLAIGTETIDVEAATELGIMIANGAAPENFDGVAEAIVMFASALVKRLPQKQENVRAGNWALPGVGAMMRDTTLGFVGFGRVARSTAMRLAGWSTSLVTYDPYVEPSVGEDYGVRFVDFDTLLEISDVVSVNTTLTEETRNIIGARQLARMREGTYLINTARGACVDEAALIEALHSGHLAGAAIDTWAGEPPSPDNVLRRMDNVIVTAHNGGHSEVMMRALPPLAVENTLRGLRGEQPVCVRNPEVLDRWHDRLKRLGLTPIG